MAFPLSRDSWKEGTSPSLFPVARGRRERRLPFFPNPLCFYYPTLKSRGGDDLFLLGAEQGNGGLEN